MSVKKNLKTNSWYATFYYIDWKGTKRRKKKEGFSTKKDALQFEQDFLATAAEQCSMKFADFAAIYLDHCRSRHKISTNSAKECIIRRFFLPHFCDMKLSEIKPRHIRRWQEQISNENTLSASYLHMINAQLSAMFSFAVKYCNLRQNPVKLCDALGSSEQRKVSFWTLDEFNAFISKLDEHSVEYAALQLLFWTGMRRGEMLALRPTDFDLENCRVSIERNLVFVKGRQTLGTPKTKSSRRTINIPKFLACIIRQHIEHHSISPSDFMFKIQPARLARCVKNTCRRIGLSPIRLHDFRHSHASMLIEHSISALAIAERLGHRNINTTLTIYAHLYPNKQKFIAEKLDELNTAAKK